MAILEDLQQDESGRTAIKNIKRYILANLPESLKQGEDPVGAGIIVIPVDLGLMTVYSRVNFAVLRPLLPALKSITLLSIVTQDTEEIGDTSLDVVNVGGVAFFDLDEIDEKDN